MTELPQTSLPQPPRTLEEKRAFVRAGLRAQITVARARRDVIAASLAREEAVLLFLAARELRIDQNDEEMFDLIIADWTALATTERKQAVLGEAEQLWCDLRNGGADAETLWIYKPDKTEHLIALSAPEEKT